MVDLRRSRIAAARLYAARGARVTVTDRRSKADLGARAPRCGRSRAPRLGGHRRGPSWAPTSSAPGRPGIPEAAAGAPGVAVTGSSDFASHSSRARSSPSPGTDGRSTTRHRGRMLRATRPPHFVRETWGEALAGRWTRPRRRAGWILLSRRRASSSDRHIPPRRGAAQRHHRPSTTIRTWKVRRPRPGCSPPRPASTSRCEPVIRWRSSDDNIASQRIGFSVARAGATQRTARWSCGFR